MTPAVSETAMAVVLLPSKSTLIALLLEVPELTTKVTVVECVSAPLVAEIVSVELPEGVLEAVVKVNVEPPEVVIEVGAKEKEAFAGNPVTLRLKFTVKQF